MAVINDYNMWQRSRIYNGLANILYSNPDKIQKRIKDIADQWDISYLEALNGFIEGKGYDQERNGLTASIDRSRLKVLLNNSVESGDLTPEELGQFTVGDAGAVAKQVIDERQAAIDKAEAEKATGGEKASPGSQPLDVTDATAEEQTRQDTEQAAFDADEEERQSVLQGLIDSSGVDLPGAGTSTQSYTTGANGGGSLRDVWKKATSKGGFLSNLKTGAQNLFSNIGSTLSTVPYSANNLSTVNDSATGSTPLIPATTPEAGLPGLDGETLMDDTTTTGEIPVDPTDYSTAGDNIDANVANVNAPLTDWILKYLEDVDPLGTATGLLSSENIYDTNYQTDKQQIQNLTGDLVTYADDYNPEAIVENFYKEGGVGQNVADFVNRNMQMEGDTINNLAEKKSKRAAELAAEQYNLGGALRSSAGTQAISEGAAMPIAEAQAQIAQRLGDLLNSQSNTAFTGYAGAESEKYQGGLASRGSQISTLSDILNNETQGKIGLAKDQANIYGDVFQNLMGYGAPDIVVSPEDEQGIISILSDETKTPEEKLDALLSTGIDIGTILATIFGG